jgi:hypothetical protein
MKSNELITQTDSPSRRKFVWGVGILSLFAAVSTVFRLPFSTMKKTAAAQPGAKKKTITMLTQDGRLVQVDEALISANRKKATDHEIQNWIKK